MAETNSEDPTQSTKSVDPTPQAAPTEPAPPEKQGSELDSSELVKSTSGTE